MSLLPSIPNAAVPIYHRGIASFRRVFRSSEAALILLAVGVGLAAGILMIAQRGIAHSMQALVGVARTARERPRRARIGLTDLAGRKFPSD